MITGYNHNVRYKEQIFHVQTEDGGDKNPYIITNLFFKGNVITQKKSPHPVPPAGKDPSDAVRDAMQEQHKEMMKSLVTGVFDHLETMKAALPEPDKKAKQIPKSSVYKICNPGGGDEKVDMDEKSEKSLDEMILEYLSDKKDQ